MKTNYLIMSVFIALLGVLFSCGSSVLEVKGIKLGDSQYIKFDFSPGFTTGDDFTFECHIKILEESKKSTMIFGTSSSYAKAYGLYLFNSKIGFGLRSANIRALVESDQYLINNWHHLAGVYSGRDKNVSFYIDGILIGSKVLTDANTSLSKAALILNGAATLQGEQKSIGHSKFVIREVRLWNVALSEISINSNKNKALKGDEKGLIGYWPMDQMEGDIAIDKTSNGRNGTIIGGEWYHDAITK